MSDATREEFELACPKTEHHDGGSVVYYTDDEYEEVLPNARSSAFLVELHVIPQSVYSGLERLVSWLDRICARCLRQRIVRLTFHGIRAAGR